MCSPSPSRPWPCATAASLKPGASDADGQCSIRTGDAVTDQRSGSGRPGRFPVALRMAANCSRSSFPSPPASPAPPTSKSLSGLKEGDEIVIGPYKVLRTLKNDVKAEARLTAAEQPRSHGIFAKRNHPRALGAKRWHSRPPVANADRSRSPSEDWPTPARSS